MVTTAYTLELETIGLSDDSTLGVRGGGLEKPRKTSGFVGLSRWTDQVAILR